MKVKLVSWNIAGGHPIASLKHLDYSLENLDYFIEELRKADADIVCLQESHTPDDGSESNAQHVANALGYPYVFNSISSASHIEKGYKLSNSILSKLPISSEKQVPYPNPNKPLFWQDGRHADTHEKNLQVTKMDDFLLANTQMLPLRLFGLAYDDNGVGSELAHGIDNVIAANISNPVLLCGDFNWPDPISIYPHLRTLNLTEALPDKDTRPSIEGAKKRPDHIFYSPEFMLINSDVLTVTADHYLCWAEFELK